VLFIDRPRLMELAWPADEVLTRVRVALFPSLWGTRIEVTHDGWDLEDDLAGQREEADRIWQQGLERLRPVF
jgi:hypothetical protein